jgi:hypothetical protein
MHDAWAPPIGRVSKSEIYSFGRGDPKVIESLSSSIIPLSLLISETIFLLTGGLMDTMSLPALSPTNSHTQLVCYWKISGVKLGLMSFVFFAVFMGSLLLGLPLG